MRIWRCCQRIHVTADARRGNGFRVSDGLRVAQVDLHVHTPSSVLESQFEGTSDGDKWNRYLPGLEAADVAVVGATDYFSIEGYLRLCEERDAGRLGNLDLILPNVEFRALPVTSGGTAVNLHVLFSPDVVDLLNDRFFSRLRYTYSGEQYACTESDLMRLGRTVTGESSLQDRPALREGMNQFKLSIDELDKVLSGDSQLRAGSLVVVPNSSRDGGSGLRASGLTATRDRLYQLADMIFSGNPQDRDYFLGKGVDSVSELERRYGGRMPCIHGSDAHSLDKIGRPDGDRHTWIKADPTFQGLRQVLHEPEDRVFQGASPPSLGHVAGNSTKYIQSLTIRKRPGSDLAEQWFDTELQVNPGLVAVIGRKGSGKSALVDSMALAGNAHNTEYSFLDKFRRKPEVKAGHFVVELSWRDGSRQPQMLSDDIDTDAPERLKYIPQRFLETVCNEPGKVDDSRFHGELKEVIFSHLPQHDRLGFGTLDTLLDHKTQQVRKAIEQHKDRLHRINEAIVELEHAMSEQNKDVLRKRIAAKERELAAHDASKPKEVLKPELDQTAQAAAVKTMAELEAAKKRRAEVAGLVEQYSGERATLSKKAAACERLHGKIGNLRAEYEAFLEDSAEDAKEVGLDPASLVTLAVDEKPLQQVRSAAARRLDELRSLLAEDTEGSPSRELITLDGTISELQGQLDSRNRAFQKYLTVLEAWQARRREIEGGPDKPDTLGDLRAELRRIEGEDARRELAGQLATREKAVRAIFAEVQGLSETLKQMYDPVQSFIGEHRVVAEQFDMRFEVAIICEGLTERFFAFVNQRTRGSFCGVDQGRKRLLDLIADADLETADGAVALTTALLDALRRDLREPGAPTTDPVEQLKKGPTVVELYDLVFSLDYLKPVYVLKLGAKDLDQLSPGEKGALLLIFYLLVDRSDIPVVVDQPEENLDNETVYKLLVPAIKQARDRRQVVMVTHNPNLAVVCDAEQVVYARLDPTDGNRVKYTSGAIESVAINRHLLDVLEGTRPAFNNRDSKYIDKV